MTEDGTGGTGWRARLHAQRRVEVQELLAERHKERRTMAGVGAAADKAMVRELSLQMDRAMVRVRARARVRVRVRVRVSITLTLTLTRCASSRSR